MITLVQPSAYLISGNYVYLQTPYAVQSLLISTPTQHLSLSKPFSLFMIYFYLHLTFILNTTLILILSSLYQAREKNGTMR